MDSQEILNITTICVSTILSVGSIILSIWFYRESNKQNKDTALMQADIKNAVEKLEQLYNRTYTDTFGALKTQIDAMQKHIFSSSVGNTNTSEPDKIRIYVLGMITQNHDILIDDLCNQIPDFKKNEVVDTIYSFHREGIIEFNGHRILYLNKNSSGAGSI